MSIPVTAYYRNANYALHAKRRFGGVETTTYMLLAVLTTNYPNEATIKQLFYLDFVKAFIVENIGGVEVVGYMCGVIPNGENSKMRRADRIFGPREKTEIGGLDKWCDLLSDGGFNTFGKSSPCVITSAKIGEIQIAEVSFKSAFYLSSSNFGIEYYQGGSWQNLGGGTSLAANAITYFGITKESIAGLKAGDTLTVRSFIENAEGKYTSLAINATIGVAGPLSLKFNATYASYASSGSVYENVYPDFLPLGDGVRFYSNLSMDTTPKSLDGYYIHSGKWYRLQPESGTDLMIITAHGDAVAGSWPSGDPGNTYPDPTLWIGYIFDFAYEYDAYINTCMVNHSGAGRVYNNPINGKVYRNWNNITNAFTTLFTGFIMRNDDCVVLQYNSGDFIGVLNP
ncbi:hypothetical protein D3C87_664160 [compost metagenome]